MHIAYHGGGQPSSNKDIPSHVILTTTTTAGGGGGVLLYGNQEGGKKLFTPNVGPRYEKMFRDDDRDQGQCMIRKDGFRFVVVSSLTPSEYEQVRHQQPKPHSIELLLSS